MKAYMSLGVGKSHCVCVCRKNQIVDSKKECVRRLKLILDTKTGEKIKRKQLAIPVLRQSFGISDWYQEEIQKLDRKTRKVIAIHGHHYPTAEIDHIHVPIEESGRKILQIEGSYIAEVVKLMEYIESNEDPPIQIVRRQQHYRNSKLLQTVNNSTKSFQSETKQIKSIIVQNIKNGTKKDAWIIIA
jgi:hypothetical protein